MPTLTDNARELFSAAHLAWLTTYRPDGSAHNTVIWVDVEGDRLVFNTAAGRTKERNLRADPRVALSVLDPEDGFHFASVNGTVELSTEDGDEVIDALAKKYLDADSYPYRQAGEVRVTARVTVQKVIDSLGS